MPTKPTILAIDPGNECGLAILRVGPTPELVHAQVIRGLEKRKVPSVQRAKLIRHLVRTPFYLAIEDMPARFFKSRAAGESFVAARTRWCDAARQCALLLGEPLDIHLARWRRVTGIDSLARRLPKDKNGKLRFKRAAQMWCDDVYARGFRNHNVCEAVAIGYAAARLLHLNQLKIGRNDTAGTPDRRTKQQTLL